MALLSWRGAAEVVVIHVAPGGATGPFALSPDYSSLGEPGTFALPYTAAEGGTVELERVTISNVTLGAGTSMSASMSLTPPGMAQEPVWQLRQASVASSGAAPISTQPTAKLYQQAGQGSIAITATPVAEGQTGVCLSFTYTADFAMHLGVVTVTAPHGWSLTGTPTTTAGTASYSGNVLTASGLTLDAGNTVTFGTTAAAAPAGGTFTASQKSVDTGKFAALPTAKVYAANGAGYVSGSTHAFAPGIQTTETLTFTVPVGGMVGGAVTVKLPPGWTLTGTPTASVGNLSVAGNAFTVNGLTLASGQVYITVPFSVPTTLGPAQFSFSEKSVSGGTMLPLSLMDVAVLADGAGTLTFPAISVKPGQPVVTLPLTYWPGKGGMSGGQLEISLPTAWRLRANPTITSNEVALAPEHHSVVGNSITMTNLSLDEGDMVVVNVTATAGSTSGPARFSARQMSTPAGSLTKLAQEPTVNVLAPGAGFATAPAPARLVTIAVGGPTLVVAGGSASFSASGADSGKGAVPLSDLTWSGTEGTISGSGAWTAPTKAGSYTITARQGSVSGSITVTVVPRALARIAVAPGCDTVLTGEALSLTASATDDYGNLIASQTYTVSAGGGSAESTHTLEYRFTGHAADGL